MDILAVNTFQHISGMPDHTMSNRFAVRIINNPSQLQLGRLAQLIENFYNFPPAGEATGLHAFLSGAINRGVGQSLVKLYDITGHLDGSNYGSPIFERDYTLLAPASADLLPEEVAFKLTFETEGRAAAPVERPDGVDAGAEVDRPKQRHTGGIFIGPLIPAAIAIVNSRVRPEAGFLTRVRKCGQMLADSIVDEDFVATSDQGLCVWSEKDAAIRPVHFLSYDDAMDTQRRRGVAPTARTRVSAFA